MKKHKTIFWICCIAFVAALAALVGYRVCLHQQEQRYEVLQDKAIHDSDDDFSVPAEQAEPEEAESTGNYDCPVDFAALQEENPDIYAWIRIPDTQLDYPILQSQGSNTDFYLDHTVTGEKGLPGAIYTQHIYNQSLEHDDVTVIYGHNMRDESMFGTLRHYQEAEYREAHPYIEVYTPKHGYTYEVVCAVTYDDRNILYTYNNCIERRYYQDFLDSLQTERKIPSWSEEPFTVTPDDHMIILSTCNGNSTQRYLVGAKLVEME